LASENPPRLEIDKRSGYAMPDLVRLFLIIMTGPVGRTGLMRELRLGEATVKTMVKFLRDRGLVDQGTRGVYPTKRGLSVFSFSVSFSGPKGITIPEFSKEAAALVVKGAAGLVKSGIEQRDEGVKFGAKIITLIKKDGRLMLAGVPHHKPPYTGVAERSLETEDGDVVILSGADSMLEAERGAVAAGLSVVTARNK
jgi:hypothetical protein